MTPHAHCTVISRKSNTPARAEKKHLTFADEQFGPDFAPLAEVIVRDELAPRIICESAGTMAEDAMAMQQMVATFDRAEN